MAGSSFAFSRPNGFEDVEVHEAAVHRWIEQTLLSRFEAYGYGLVRVPTLEYVDLYHWTRIGAPLFHQLLIARISEPRVFPSYASGDEGFQADLLLSRVADTTDVSHEVVLRPDLTAPLARAYLSEKLESARAESELPERRAYAGQVFRNVKPAPLRQKEFRQVGVELVGSEEPLADLEVLFLACDATRALGVPSWALHLGHARLYQSILKELGIERAEGLRAICADLEQLARDRVIFASGVERARQYLSSRCGQLRQMESEPPDWMEAPDSLEPAQLHQALSAYNEARLRTQWADAWGLSTEAIERVMALAYLPVEPVSFFKALEPYCRREESRGHAAHLRYLSEALEKRGGIILRMTPASSRGIGYYTGVTFEIHRTDSDNAYTDICGGGRYDALYPWVQERSIRTAETLEKGTTSDVEDGSGTLGRQIALSTREGRLAAIGFAFGVERVTAALRTSLPDIPPSLDVFIALPKESLAEEAFALATELRDAGFRVRAHLKQPGRSTGLGEQLGYAHHSGVPFVIILGDEEMEKGEVAVKTMATQEQVRLSRSELVTYLRRLERHASVTA